MNNIESVVKSRHSVRSYKDQKIEGEVLNELQKEIQKCSEESGLNIKLVLNEEKAFGKTHYGSFDNCKNYIVIMGEKNRKDLDEASGYYGEKIVLKAQEIGLNTCWTKLTYNKAEVPCTFNENEKISIVIAIGYGKVSGVNHKSKEFSAVSKTIENVPDWYKKGVEFALYAPTALNQQKFKFELKGSDEVSLKTEGLGLCTKIDLGIVKYHFELGAGLDNFKWSE